MKKHKIRRYGIKIVNIRNSKLVLPDQIVDFVLCYLILRVILYFTLLDIQGVSRLVNITA